MKHALPTLQLLLLFVMTAAADTFIVDNTDDPGGVCASPGCSLRAAIDEANNNPGVDTINFNIPGTGPHTIALVAPLPDLLDTVTIDGYTQPGASANTLEVGNNAVLLIELSGSLAGFSSGLVLDSDGNLIRGLVINRFEFLGIAIEGNDNVIAGNFIGTDVAGTTDLGNTTAGVGILIGTGNLIGGAVPGARNLISGNDGWGVLVWGVNGPASDNSIQGNYIGTDRNGVAALPNAADGVIDFTVNNHVGGTEAGTGNVISGNGGDGVHISVGFTGDTVQGNFIGTDATGTVQLENSGSGVEINDASANIIGGTTASARNVISGNGDDGIGITDGATGNLVQGNFIGTDATGTIDIGNASHGVEIGSASSNTIGGLTPAARNIISGNTGSGVAISGGGASNVVQGNYIGTDVTGSAALGNFQNGVSTNASPDNIIGGAVPGAGNLISANSFGIQIAGGAGSTGNLIQGNLIGTDVTGTSPLGNAVGILLFDDTTNTTVGGPGVAGNTIAFTTATKGVDISSGSSGNHIFGNSIFGNAALGINLRGGTEDVNSVTANDPLDADTGPNELQNYPVISGIVAAGSDRSVEGELSSKPNTDYTLDFYSNGEVDPSGFGEGETYLGSLDVHTSALGEDFFNFPLEANAAGQFITATATDPNGNTSEFSLASELVPPFSRFLNISTRLRVQTGDNVLIGGFIITGNDPKEVIVRAIGPSLGDFGVADPLANPTLELHYQDGTIVTNDNWRDTQEAEIIVTGLAPNDDLESAIVATLEPGAYTAIVRGVNDGTGVALVETYDLNQAVDSSLANISTRGLVETGDNVMIGGIIVGPDTAPSGSILLRAIGPTLSNFGITNPLANPILELRDGDGVLVMANDNWKSTQQAAIEATGLAPNDDLESAILATLAVGNYTAIMQGLGGATGIGLVEAYHLD